MISFFLGSLTTEWSLVEAFRTVSSLGPGQGSGFEFSDVVGRCV